MIEVLYGVNVVDESGYAAYRAHMTPILEAHGGAFRVDTKVAEVLRAPSPTPFNRLFTICFPTLERLEAFFANPEYLAVRRRFFEPSVSATTVLGRYQVLP